MSKHFFNDMTLKIDNASGTLTDISGSVNQASLQSTQEMLDSTVLNSSTRGNFPGLAGATLPISGFINSTTDGILGPLCGNRTSITKTFEFYNGESYYNGEMYPTDVQMTGSSSDLITFSCNLTLDGAVTRTSVAL